MGHGLPPRCRCYAPNAGVTSATALSEEAVYTAWQHPSRIRSSAETTRHALLLPLLSTQHESRSAHAENDARTLLSISVN